MDGSRPTFISLLDDQLSFASSDVFDQGILNLVREKSGKCQGILFSMVCGNPACV